jgi:hypothetical protein
VGPRAPETVAGRGPRRGCRDFGFDALRGELATQQARSSSAPCGPAQFVLSGYALMALVHALDPTLEYYVFCLWQQLGDLIDAGSAIAPEVVNQLADLELVAPHCAPVDRLASV